MSNEELHHASMLARSKFFILKSLLLGGCMVMDLSYRECGIMNVE